MSRNMITTSLGRWVNPLDLQPEDLDIRDIGHALAHICRFGGHSLVFYSVAEHSVLVSRLCPPEYALEALLHDASEAYLGDVPKPLKVQWPEYQAAEKRAHIVIAKRFGVPEEVSSAVHAADGEAFRMEYARLIMQEVEPRQIEPLQALPPTRARNLFFERYIELTGRPWAEVAR